jgi:hypothetical protein
MPSWTKSTNREKPLPSWFSLITLSLITETDWRWHDDEGQARRGHYEGARRGRVALGDCAEGWRENSDLKTLAGVERYGKPDE